MSNIPSMLKAIEFIENNLKEEIAVADMAEAVSHSVFHFCRTFNKIIHHTPYDYLIRRRLSESARELLEPGRSITDIALAYQFNNPETYTRAFKRMFAQQPYQWRKQGHIDRRFFCSRLTLEHLQHLHRGDYLRPVLVEKEAFYVAGMMALVRADRAVISQLWEMLRQELPTLTTQIKPERYYGNHLACSLELEGYEQNFKEADRSEGEREIYIPLE
jgi:AraC family transcriptional regulator